MRSITTKTLIYDEHGPVSQEIIEFKEIPEPAPDRRIESMFMQNPIKVDPQEYK